MTVIHGPHVNIRPYDDVNCSHEIHQHDPEDHANGCCVAVAEMPYERWKVENEDEWGEDGEDNSLRDDVGFDNHVVLWCSHCLRLGGEDRRRESFAEVDVGAVGRPSRNGGG